MPNHLFHPRIWGFLLVMLPAAGLQAQVHYTLSYTDTTSSQIVVTIEPARPMPAPVELVMPRSVPGDYAVTKYDLFVDSPRVFDAAGRMAAMTRNDLGAPRWACTDSGFTVQRIVYSVDLKKMDAVLHAASDKSIVRPGFAGLLNYSVLGWIDGCDRQPATCSIRTAPSWPIFSTLAPAASPAEGALDIKSSDYYTLADGQTFIGPRFRVKEYPALVPVFIADYSEAGQADLDNYGWMETQSLAILKDYFGELPFPYYCALFRECVRLPDDDPGNFAMEHLQSSTFFGDTDRIQTTRLPESRLWRMIPSYLHHMAHAFIPLRCYGDNYRPYVLEIPPVIDDIWFNEGYMWYIVADTLKNKGMLESFRKTVFEGAPDIQQLSLTDLSRVASTQYAEDFRLGEAVFSRGALMAAEINDYLKAKTGGRSSMRTVYRYLYAWSRKNNRPFTLAEFPGLLQAATGIDITAIYDKWQQPPLRHNKNGRR